MRVLQINCVYGKGSTGQIVRALHRALPADGFESFVLYGRGDPPTEPDTRRVCGDVYGKLNGFCARLTGLPYGGCGLSTRKVIRTIRRTAPDVVHLHCINGHFVNIYRLVAWLKEHRIPTVLTLHAEFMYTGGCSHAFDCEKWRTGCGHCPDLKRATKSYFLDRTGNGFSRMKAAFDGFEDLRVVSVSPWLMERARTSPILQAAGHEVVLNGVDTEVFHPYDTDDLRKSLRVNGRRVVFHATAMFRDRPGDPKGGGYVFELARRMKEEPILFVVAGRYELLGEVPDNVILLGEIRDPATLAGYYSLADVTLLTSLRETYSMICAESLCCGTPVVGFRAGAPEGISLPDYSRFVEQGDVDALEAALRAWLPRKAQGTGELARDAAAAYDKMVMIHRYEEVYRSLLCDCT